MSKDEDTAYEQERQKKLDEEGARYFAFTERETVLPLGRFTSLDSALCACEDVRGVGVIWVFDEVSLRKLMTNCMEVLR